MLLIQKLKLTQYILIFKKLLIVSLTVSYLVSCGPLGSLVGCGDGFNVTSSIGLKLLKSTMFNLIPYQYFPGFHKGVSLALFYSLSI